MTSEFYLTLTEEDDVDVEFYETTECINWPI